MMVGVASERNYKRRLTRLICISLGIAIACGFLQSRTESGFMNQVVGFFGILALMAFAGFSIARFSRWRS